MDLLCEPTTLLCTQGHWRQGPKHLCSGDIVHRSKKLEITPVSTEMMDREVCYRRTVGLSLSLEGMMFKYTLQCGWTLESTMISEIMTDTEDVHCRIHLT